MGMYISQQVLILDWNEKEIKERKGGKQKTPVS